MIDYDPERKLWVPGRRRFLFLGIAAAAWQAAGLPSQGSYYWHGLSPIVIIRYSAVDWDRCEIQRVFEQSMQLRRGLR